jgi:phenylalanyl-tRNA synthetase beta chain
LKKLLRSLIPGLLKTAVYNINRNSTDLRLFEMGRIFLGTDPDDAEQQPYHLAGLLHGSQQMPGWSAERLPIDFYDVKGYCEAFLGKIFLDNLEFILYDNNAYFEPSEVTAVKKNGRILGRFGKVRGTVCDIFDLDSPVYAFEFSVPGIQMFFDYKRLYRPYSRYPFVEKDVAFIIANDVHAEDIRRYILNSAKALLQRVEIFDVYSGDRLPEGEKSIAFRLRFQSDSKTLQDAEVNRIFDQIIGSINSKFNARLREG